MGCEKVTSICKKQTHHVGKVKELHSFQLYVGILLCVVTMMSSKEFLQGRSRDFRAGMDRSCSKRTLLQVSLTKLKEEKISKKDFFFLFSQLACIIVDSRPKCYEIENNNAS